MDEKPKRRWFRFSLRTLFMVVTVCSFWLGWQIKFIRHRQQRRQWVVDHGGGAHGFDDPLALGKQQLDPIPWFRQLRGDKGVAKFILPPHHSKAEWEQVATLFPEADCIDLSGMDGDVFVISCSFSDDVAVSNNSEEARMADDSPSSEDTEFDDTLLPSENLD